MTAILVLTHNFKHKIVRLSKLSILSVPDEVYSRNVLCTLNLISTFLFESGSTKDYFRSSFSTEAFNLIFFYQNMHYQYKWAERKISQKTPYMLN